MNRKIRLAWVSTYNSRCGLATYSEHLLAHFDRELYDIAIIGNDAEPVKPDPADLIRLWPDRSGSLGAVREFIRGFDAVFVNFHFSLMELHDLAEMLRAAQFAGIDTYVTLHKTLDTAIDERVVSLGEIAETLRLCTRLIVHTKADIARLKGFAVSDNVVMIPPGAIDRPALDAATARRLLGLRRYHPIIGTFGFLLPPKGLPQLIHAFALVLRDFPEAMLLLLNAQYPGAVELLEERDRCQALIGELGLDDRVRLVDEFLETEEILLLLSACDLTVFPYQASGEFDSGAVRLGLAAGRPVATTPLAVFASLEGIVHPLPGLAAADIAEGILKLLGDPALCATILQLQQAWISRNSWAHQATRIDGIIRGGFEERHAVALCPTPPHANRDPEPPLTALADRVAARLSQRDSPPSPVLATTAGRSARPGGVGFAGRWPETCGVAIEWLPAMKVGRAGERRPGGISAKPGEAGHLVYGPYARLGAGDYRVRICWDAGQPERMIPRGEPVAAIEAVSRYGETYLAQRELQLDDYAGSEHELLLRIPERPAPIEVRVWTSGAVPLTVSSITVERLAAPQELPHSAD